MWYFYKKDHIFPVYHPDFFFHLDGIFEDIPIMNIQDTFTNFSQNTLINIDGNGDDEHVKSINNYRNGFGIKFPQWDYMTKYFKSELKEIISSLKFKSQYTQSAQYKLDQIHKQHSHKYVYK